MKPKDAGSRPLNNPYRDRREERNDKGRLEEADVGQRRHRRCPSVTQPGPPGLTDGLPI